MWKGAGSAYALGCCDGRTAVRRSCLCTKTSRSIGHDAGSAYARRMLQYSVGGVLGDSLSTAARVHTYHAQSTDTEWWRGCCHHRQRRCLYTTMPTDSNNSSGGGAYALCLRVYSIAAHSDCTIWGHTENWRVWLYVLFVGGTCAARAQADAQAGFAPACAVRAIALCMYAPVIPSGVLS